MKLSKSLLQAIAVGITMGVGVSSCSLVEDVKLDKKEEKKAEKIHSQDDGNSNTFHCLACGRG